MNVIELHSSEKVTTAIHQVFLKKANHQNSYVLVDRNPTFNCQIASIAGFNQLVYATSQEEFNKNMETVLSIVTKNILLVDLQREYEVKLEEYLGTGCTILKAPYTSTRKSSMIIYLLEVTKIKKHIGL